MSTPAKKQKSVKDPDHNAFNHPETARGLNRKLLKSQKNCDVFFVVGPERERIGAHKLILGGRSPVFEVMFSERWEESSSGQEGNEIVWEQEEPSTLHQFLEYVYADVFGSSAVEAIKLLQLAQFYDVQPLVRLCQTLLAKPFPVDDVLQIFTTARKYALSEVVSDASEFMASNLSQLVKSPTFLKADEAILIYLLEREDLVIEESKLFSAVLQWADKQIENSALDPKPSRKDLLKNLIALIRFPAMTSRQFAEAVASTNVLPPQTALNLFIYLNSDPGKRNELSSSIPYNKTPRRGVPFQLDLYMPRSKCSRPGVGTYCYTALKKYPGFRDMLTFTLCQSAGIKEKGLITRIVSLVLQAPRFDEPIFGNSAEAATNMSLPIVAAVSLCLDTANKDGVKHLVRVSEEVFVNIGQEKLELRLDRPWELSSCKPNTIVLRLLSVMYKVPDTVYDGSSASRCRNRDQKFDYFTPAKLQDKVSHQNIWFGGVELSSFSLSGDIGRGPIPSASESACQYSATYLGSALSSGLHLLRSVKIAFA